MSGWCSGIRHKLDLFTQDMPHLDVKRGLKCPEEARRNTSVNKVVMLYCLNRLHE
jgi:hypothetical protein